jgi:hypothetical protein
MAKQNYTYSTAQERIEEHRKRVGDAESTQIEYMQEESLIDAINTFERQIINAPFVGMEIDPTRRITVPGNGRGWDFMERDKQFKFIPWVSIEEGIIEGATGNLEISDTTGFKNEAGAAVIYDQYGTWDYVTYAGMTDPDLVTMGDISIDHDSGEQLSKLYKLPTNFARAKALMINDEEWHEGRENPIDRFFCTYNGFLWVPRSLNNGSGTLTYFKQRTAIDDIEQTLNIPDILNPVLDNLLDARAFSLGGDDQNLISGAFFAAADALRGAMGYTVSTSNKRINLARRPSRSPTWERGGISSSQFDSAHYND